LTGLGRGQFKLVLKVVNISAQPLFIRELVPFDVSFRRGRFLEFQSMPTSWTFLGTETEMCRMPMDLCNQRWDFYRTHLAASGHTILADRRSGRYLTLGFLDQRRFCGVIRLVFGDSSLYYFFQSLKAVCECDDLRLAPGETLTAEPLYINTHDLPKAALNTYTNLVLKHVPVRRSFKPEKRRARRRPAARRRKERSSPAASPGLRWSRIRPDPAAGS